MLESALAQSHRRIRVLVVEDDIDQRVLIGRRLEEVGAEVTTVGTASEALESLEGVDLVLLDYRLPDMGGLEALAVIAERRGPSVVMVTGMGSESVAVQAMRSGAVDYVVKDATYLETIPEIVERAWRTHDLQRRSAKLQELILLLNEADERETVFHEIVRGAQELLNARSCILALLDDDGGVDIGAALPDGVPLSAHAAALAEDAARSGRTTRADSLVVVPLSKDERLGALLIEAPEGVSLSEREVELAETFASFAGLAVRKLRRHEIERELIAELQEILEMRRRFVNSVSHEIRTPLACISGFSTTLLNYWGRLDEETMRSSVEKIYRHAGDLTSLVDGLLDFGNFELGRFKARVQPMELRRHVESTIAALEPLLGDHEVNLEIPECKVMADPELLDRVFSNLLSNSVKASEPGTPITIVAIPENEMIRIDVVDRGHGLSPEDLSRVFEPFWRSSRSVSDAQRGSGLGLALVREYVRAMRGEVGVESTPGEGARFFFKLPTPAAT